jgi:hypothetical protein
MPRAVRRKIEALLLDLPATSRGKQFIPRYADLLDTILAKVSDAEHPRNWRHADARLKLVRIAELIENLSPAARAGLTSGPLVNPHWLAAVFREAAEEIDRLRLEHVELDRGGQPRGRGPNLAAGAIANAAASAYALITETTPPVVDYYGTSTDHPFRRLVAELFVLANLRASSESQARAAAARLKRVRIAAK